MERWTERRLHLAFCWLENYSRREYYAISLATETRRSWVADQRKVDGTKFQYPSMDKLIQEVPQNKQEPKGLTKEQINNFSKNRVIAALTNPLFCEHPMEIVISDVPVPPPIPKPPRNPLL